MLSWLQLPQYIQCRILRDWLNLKSLALMDSAACESVIRRQLLYTLSSNTFFIDNLEVEFEPVYPEEVEMMYWIMRRHIKAKTLNFVRDSPIPLLLDVIHASGGCQVQTVEICDMITETQGIFVAIFSSCPNISRISIQNCTHWVGVSALRGQAQLSLKELVVVDCGTNKATKSFAHNCFPNLEVLDLSGEYAASVVNSLLRAAPHLECLRLYETYVDSTGIAVLSQHSGRLRTLTLHDCSQVLDVALLGLAPHCVNLRDLCITGGHKLTADVLTAFVASCPELRRLEVDSTCSVSDLCSAVQHCGDRLLFLSMSSVVFPNPEALSTVAAHCRHLEALQLANCEGVSALCLVSLISTLTALRRLVLSCLNAVTDDVLLCISLRLMQLSSLSLYGSSGYTCAGALSLTQSPTSLLEFNVDFGNSVFNRLALSLWERERPGLKVVNYMPMFIDKRSTGEM